MKIFTINLTFIDVFKKILLALAVYNSYSNLEKILINLKRSNYNKLIKDIIIIDNNSVMKEKDKTKIIKIYQINSKKNTINNQSQKLWIRWKSKNII